MHSNRYVSGVDGLFGARAAAGAVEIRHGSGTYLFAV